MSHETEDTAESPGEETAEQEQKATPLGDEFLGEDEDDSGLRGRLEGILPDTLKRAMLSGLGALFVTEETIRSAVSDMRLPKEAVGYILNQADNSKEQLFSLVANEVGRYLERLDLSEETAKILSKLTLEVNTKISFSPSLDNEKPPFDKIKPDIKTEVSLGKLDKKREPEEA